MEKKSKITRIMKLTCILLFLSVSMLFASGTCAQNTHISLSVSDKTVAEVLETIEKKTDFHFFYNGKFVNTNRLVSVNVKNKDVFVILEQLFNGQNVTYKVFDKDVILTASDVNDAGQQKRIITGTVIDEFGEPVIGASIVEKGTTNGTTTDIDGRFTFSVSENATLVVSYIGYISQNVVVGNKTNMLITLLEDTKSLEEVVVIGYGTVKKKDLTGAVAQISPDAYKAQPVQGVSEMLRGNAPGVMVKSTGVGGTVIRIRGSNSINGSNDPLYIVDGVPMGSYSPNDVESVEVLKDASATAIYGSRGANGVVLITTKRGKTGDPVVEISANSSFATYPEFYDLLSGPEFADFYNNYFDRNVNFDKNVDTDWQKKITQTGIRQNYQANISGGTEKMKFYVGGNYIDNTQLIKNQYDRTYRIRSNFDFKLSSKFTGRIDLSASQGRSHSSNTTAKGPLLNALSWAPSVPIYDEHGDYIITDPYGITTTQNPYYVVMEGNNNSYSTNVVANGYFAYEVIPGLKISAQPSFSKSISENRNFENAVLNTSGLSEAYRYTNNSTTWQLTGLATYDKVFAGVHNLNVMLGAEVYESESNNFSSTGQDVSYDYMLWYNIGSSAIKDIGSGYGAAQLASFFARVNYNYDSKYYITASMRADGSSKFRDDNQFSYFPSGALSWVVSNEDFLKDNEWLNLLKIRGSYGVTGSQAIGSYATIAALRNRRNWSWGTGTRVQGIELNAPVNTGLKWEETTQWDIGIDAYFLDKWSVSLDYYHKVTDGLLTQRQLPEYAGSGSTLINLGEMQNKGIDASVTYTPFKTKDFTWRMTAIASWMANKVVSLGEIGEYFIPDNDSNFSGVQLEGSPLIVQEGESLGQMFGYKWLGLWGTNEADEAAKYNQKPGDNKYLDKNGNYEYDNDDREVIGNFMPTFNWSYNTSVSWKNFDFNLLIEGSHGQDMYNFNRMLAGTVIGQSGSVNLREAAENIWSPSNQNTMWSPNSTSALEKANSSKWVQKADWVKFRNISVGYTIPKHLLKGHEFRVSVSAQNLWTITSYKGMDPEASVNGGRGSDIYGGVEYGTFPSPRIYTVGLNYKF